MFQVSGVTEGPWRRGEEGFEHGRCEELRSWIDVRGCAVAMTSGSRR